MRILELTLVALVLLFALLAVGGGSARPVRAVLCLGGVLAMALLGAWWTAPLPALNGVRPGALEGQGFATSDTCLACHPDQHASWRASYHSRMTQLATPQAVLADFDQVELEDRGRRYRMERRGDEFWVEMQDPLADFEGRGDGVPIRERVVMTTGSHHLQTYWIRPEHGGGRFFQVPWVWHVADRRWMPSLDSFLRPPPTTPVVIEVWNSGCIDCHTVGGQPGFDVAGQRADSRVAELGIACESCHGPGAAHAAAQRSPLERYARHFAAAGDTPSELAIVQPQRLSGVRSIQVCGQCHSASGDLDLPRWFREGRRYRAGGRLEEEKLLLRYEEEPAHPLVRAWLQQEPDGLRGRFWRDGAVRVAGREANGVLESACLQDEDFSCLSCHSMHSGEPDDQLATAARGDAACVACHADIGAAGSGHTRHAAGGAGSACYDCHMPRTTYGLFTAMRSHKIDSPSAQNTLQSGRPNACNLCHVDRPLAWSAEWLERWWSVAPPAPERWSREQREVSQTVLDLLRGDAVQRVLAAWHLGWDHARQAAGEGWQAPLLAQLLDDPYAVVRYVAWRALRAQPGFESFEYDFVAPEEGRAAARERALARSRELGSSPRSSQVLQDAQGAVDLEAVSALRAQRDDRPVRIIE